MGLGSGSLILLRTDKAPPNAVRERLTEQIRSKVRRLSPNKSIDLDRRSHKSIGSEKTPTVNSLLHSGKGTSQDATLSPDTVKRR